MSPDRGVFAQIMSPVMAVLCLPSVHVSEVAAAELEQAMNGFNGRETLENSDLIELGGRALEQWGVQKT